MPNQRSADKKLIGAQASAEIWHAVDAWLDQNPGKSVTDFLLDACIEKLNRAGIRVDPNTAKRDHRARVPLYREQP